MYQKFASQNWLFISTCKLGDTCHDVRYILAQGFLRLAKLTVSLKFALSICVINNQPINQSINQSSGNL